MLYSFQGGTKDGSVPVGGVVFDKAGNLYGATTYTTSCATTFDCGTMYELSPPQQSGGPWVETTLHVFQGHDHNDGGSPEGGVILDAAGNVYGTTAYGGGGPCMLFGTVVGCGAVYEMIAPTKPKEGWKEKILYNFQGDKDGQFPNGDLVFDKSGNLYGATQFGGGYGSCDAPYYKHCGTIFELIAPKTKGGKWTEKVLYSFKSVSVGKQVGDGANPNGGLILDSAGTFYGTTRWGGLTTNDCAGGNGFVGCGAIFKLISPTREGGIWSEAVLYRFKGRPDGVGPNGGLVFDAKGRLYGTAVGGGRDSGDGTVFKLTPGKQWKEGLLHTFDVGRGQGGATPEAGLTVGSAGYLYGVASGGGTAGDGTVFWLRPTADGWEIATLHTFTGAPDGASPASKVVFDIAGNLYGTTQQGGNTGQNCGNYGCGTVFAVLP